MSSLNLVILALCLTAASGVPGLFLSRSSGRGQRLAAGFMAGGALAGLAGSAIALSGAPVEPATLPWPALGNGLIGVDALSAFFLVPVFLMGALGSLYALGYWPHHRHPGNSRKLGLFWGLLVAGMTLLVIGRHALSFLLGWEIMALSAFFLVATEDQREESRRAGWIYLIATHVGTLTLFALFVLWRRATGSYNWVPVTGGTLSLGLLNGLFFLALFGFGLKAGLMPLHFWLPGAHANAPCHVSAMLSGVVLKMGVYGLVRFLSLLPAAPAAWGGLLLLLGASSGLLGVVYAIAQHDLKRLLAYHSVENIGIIFMGLGVAMLGRSAGRPEWVALGLAGCLLHVWNHSFFKALLFLCAGSVVHGAHSRQIDRLGGLAKLMPWTAALFLVGAVAICGLPPLNGFVSELFVYLGLLRAALSNGASMTAAACVPVLAMIGALALACFVKVYGAIFLGTPRTPAGAQAHESPLAMRGPMMVLAACCALIGLAPALLAPTLDRVVASWCPELNMAAARLHRIAPLREIGILAMVLVALGAGLVLFFSARCRLAPQVGTWDCGYARPTSRMQYTASSFAQTIIRMFRWLLHPHRLRPRLSELFPTSATMHSHVDDTVLDQMLLPAGHRVERVFAWFRRFQQGLIQHYVLYILITLIVMLSTLISIRDLLVGLFAQ
ncbi:MAG: proton-conducting transporter membrane subunit [Kiritimatiellia bacterium]